MKKLNRLFKPGVIVALISMASTTANADVVDGSAVATLISPLSILENAAVNFGTVSGGPAAGSVILTTANARSTTGDAQLIGTDGTAGAFTVTGESGQAVIVTFSATATISDGTNTMEVNSFRNTLTADELNGSATLSAASVPFQVGATLVVGASQPAGDYSTASAGGVPYTVTINYQ